MKKTLLVAAFALAGSFAFAQKPSAGNKTAEVNLNFQTGTSAISYNLPAELRLRYFLADNSALRIRFGLASGTDKSSVKSVSGDVTSDITNKTGFGLTLTPGYEMHFEGTSKLSPYAGAQLGISLGGKMSTEVTNSAVSNPTSGDVVKDNSFKTTSGSVFGLNLGLMMGADYYIADGVYVGAEFGLGLFGMTSVGEGETTVKIGGNSVTNKTTKSSSNNLFGVSTGGVRLGFVF
ncbi:MAG: hypothetical protein K9H61_12730 [Bacteroidia bacterium]|nr:hypothetical protein [Bacteroidia bacterium]MCF8425303.1 hypothetical protein [Bacteroidia bacterium]MCF8447849.1 hypothetical protein [Bacteroidia bacterium]